MAHFTFALQPLLRHRERLEQDCQQELAVVNGELAEVEAALHEAEQTVLGALADLRQNRLVGPIDLAFLTAHRRFMSAMQRQGAERAQRAAAVRQGVAAAQQRLAAAVKDRRAIELLRDQHLERWRAEEVRRETAAGDEVAMQMAAADLAAGDGRDDDDEDRR